MRPIVDGGAMDEWRYERPWMYPKQEAAIFDPARVSIVEACTKSGKTVGCMAWILERAWLGGRHWNHWWIAPYNPQARIAYRRMKTGLPPQLYRYHDTDQTITLSANKAVVWFKGSEKPDTLYGEDVHSAVVDEATRVREESWWAVRSTLTKTRGPIRLIGNVKGRKNWAFRMARRAEQGQNGYAYHRLIAYDAVEAGVLSAEEIAEAKRDLPEEVFNELYLAIPSEEGANPFGIRAIRDCIAPMSDRSPVVWGWDLARKEDYTVGVALDVTGRVCRLERFQRSWPATEDTILETCGDTFTLVDSTGVGDPVLGNLQRRGGDQFDGFLFTTRSKQQLVEGLALAIQRGSVYFPEGVIVRELEEFEYQHTRTGVTYGAPEGLHDDCVDALGLAWKAFTESEWQPAELW